MGGADKAKLFPLIGPNVFFFNQMSSCSLKTQSAAKISDVLHYYCSFTRLDAQYSLKKYIKVGRLTVTKPRAVTKKKLHY